MSRDGFQRRLAQVKARATIAGAAKALGWTLETSKSLCPHCGTQRMGVRPDGKGYRCGCGESGDVIRFYQTASDSSFGEAVESLFKSLPGTGPDGATGRLL